MLCFAHALGPEPSQPAIPGDYELQWTAPESCPDASTILARVRELAPDWFPAGAPARIEGTVRADGDGYQLDLRTDFEGVRHNRALRSASCEDLGESTALVIAVALREGFASAMRIEVAPEPPSEAIALAPPPSAPLATPVVAAPVHAPAPRRMRYLARLVGLAEIGALGVVTGGVAAALGLSWSRLRVEVGGTYLVPRARTIADGRGGTFQAGMVQARACGVVGVRRLELPLCGGFEGGVVRVDAIGLPGRRLMTGWFGPEVLAAMVWPVGPVRLVVGAAAVARVVGSQFRIDRQVEFRQLPLSFRGFAGIELAW